MREKRFTYIIQTLIELYLTSITLYYSLYKSANVILWNTFLEPDVGAQIVMCCMFGIMDINNEMLYKYVFGYLNG